jgi:hypothetical protein
MKKFIFSLITFLFSLSAHCQNLVVEGILLDSTTNEAIEGANITIDFNKKIGLKSDKEGRFAFLLPQGDHTISIKHVGYLPFWIYTNANTKNMDLVIKMKRIENELEQIVVVSKGYDQSVKKPILGVNQINIKTLKKIPAAFGEVDILRGLQMLPGVTSVGEASNGVNIRGGTTDQNLILLDDTPIFNPTHMFGLFSAVPPEAISNLELYKGNVPARYGGRAASVLDINLKTPDLQSFKMNGGISLISNKLMVETPIIKDKLGIYIAARGAFNDFLLPIFSDNFDSVRTTFSEMVGKIFYKVNQKNTLTLMGYGSNNYFQTNLLSTLPNVVGKTTFFEHSALNFNLKWVYLINSKFDLSTSLINADYNPTIGTIETKNNNKVRLNSGVYQQQVKSSLNFQNDKQKVETGISYTNYTIRPGNLDPAASESVNSISLPSEFATEAAIFVDNEYAINPKLAITGGLRYSYFLNRGPGEVRSYDPLQAKDEFSVIETKNYGKGEVIKTYGGLEPRFGVRYSVNENSSVKFGYNLMRQYLQIVSNTTTPIPTSRWKTSDTHIKPQVSHLLTLGLYKNLNANIYELSIEGYYRGSQNIIDYKPGADFLLQRFPETELVQGISKSYGLELMLSKKKGNLTGWTNYTYARTLNRVYASNDPTELVNNGDWYNANFDRPHSFNTSIDVKVDDHNSFSFNFVLSSGRPYSEPVGFVTYQGNLFPFYDERNNKRIPAYHRLDFAWNISNPSMKKKDWQGNWVFSVYNLYSRKNPYSIFFESTGNNIKAYRLLIFGAPIVSLAYNFQLDKKK